MTCVHSFELVQLVNAMYDGTALVSAQARVICRKCGLVRDAPFEQVEVRP